VHKGDLTGIEIINRIMEQVWALDVGRLEEHRAIELIPARDGSCLAGVLLIDMRSGEYRLVQAKAVLLATGGGPTMYLYHTPSGDKSCDGLAMALRAGLSLRDMEMVQFHPTGLLAGPDTRMTGTVLEEGLRGAGGWLVNGAGERFMHKYDPAGERATRDVVSRAIDSEMRAGNTTPMGGVYIQMSHLGPRVEVVPTAHYMMGGVEFDADCKTTIPGLFAAGEDCGGVHGANRLGGNGVANSTVFGGIAGESMAKWVAECSTWADCDEPAVEDAIGRAEYPFALAPGDIGGLREKLWRTMWDDVGVVRSKAALQRGLATLDEHTQELRAIGLADGDRTFNLTWHDWLNLESLIETSRVIATAALAREDSRGAHFREDYPEAGDLNTTRYIRISRDGERLMLDTVPVEFAIVSPGESLIDGEAGAPAVETGGTGQ
jgi:fumarate reductase flavoprotein subunit